MTGTATTACWIMPTIPGIAFVYQPLAKAGAEGQDVFQAELEGGLVDVVTAG